MKVLFMGVGLVPYFNQVLNKLNEQPGVEILNLVDKNGIGHAGAGVFQTRKDVNFRILELEGIDYENGYHGFKDFSSLLEEVRPDIVVTSDYYIGMFVFDPKTAATAKSMGVKIILKSIPFRLNRYETELRMVKSGRMMLNSLNPWARRLAKLFFLDVLFSKFFLRGKRETELQNRKILFNLPDAHVNYVEDAYEVYGSYGVPKEKIFITYNSPDTDKLFAIREELEREGKRLSPPAGHRLIHVGRLVEWKRVDLLIRAVASLKKKYEDIELLVLGLGPEKENLEKLAGRLRLSKQVKFAGGVHDPKELGRYLMASDIYVLAGMGGLSINDAMAFGLPVICSVCDGTEKKLVKEGINGAYFKEADGKDLARKIDYLFNHLDILEKMGKCSTEIIRNEINIHTVVNGYLRAFNYVSGRKG